MYIIIAQWLEYFVYTLLQTTDINKTFDLHIKFVYEVIALHQRQENMAIESRCLSTFTSNKSKGG